MLLLMKNGNESKNVSELDKDLTGTEEMDDFIVEVESVIEAIKQKYMDGEYFEF